MSLKRKGKRFNKYFAVASYLVKLELTCCIKPIKTGKSCGIVRLSAKVSLQLSSTCMPSLVLASYLVKLELTSCIKPIKTGKSCGIVRFSAKVALQLSSTCMPSLVSQQDDINDFLTKRISFISYLFILIFQETFLICGANISQHIYRYDLLKSKEASKEVRSC